MRGGIKRGLATLVAAFILIAFSGPVSAVHSGPPDFLMDNTPVTTCNGVFLDSGGELNNYSNLENFTKTFFPGNPASEKLRFEFKLFDIETSPSTAPNPFDMLEIYDGNSTSAPSLGRFFLRKDFSTGQIVGGMAPGTITSTATDGSLTFRFVTDNLTTRSGWRAEVSCAPAYTTVFTTDGQSLWGSGAVKTIPDSQRFEYFTYDFSPDRVVNRVESIFGKRFGAATNSGSKMDLGLRVKVSNIETGNVKVRYPVEVSFSNSPADSFRVGDVVTINTFGRLSTEDAPSIITTRPDMKIDLDARVTFATHVGAVLCFFDCISLDLLNAVGLPKMQTSGRDSLLELDTKAKKVTLVGQVPQSVTTTPYTIPPVPALASGISGRVDTPSVGLPNSPAPTTIQGMAIMTGGEHHFMDLTIDMDTWMTRGAGLPKAAGFLLQSPQPVPVPFPPPPFPPGKVSWKLFDLDVLVDMFQQFKFTFLPKLRVTLAFTSASSPGMPPVPVQFKVRRNGMVIHEATGTFVTIDPGDSLELVVPDAELKVTPTFTLSDTTFVNENTTRFVRNRRSEALQVNLTMPSVHVGCVPQLGKCPFCTPAFCLGYPGLNLDIGPAVDVTIPDIANNDPRLFGAARRQFSLLGFAPMSGSSFGINPEFQPVAVIDGPAAPVNEGDSVSFNATQSSDGDNDSLTFSWDFGDGGTGIGPTTGEIVTHEYGDNGVYLVTLTADDGHGVPGLTSHSVTVLNVGPTRPGPAPIDQTVEEGEQALISPGTIDPGFLDSFISTVSWGDSTSFLFDTLGALNLGPVDPVGHVYADNGIYPVIFCDADDDGEKVCGTLTVTVDNVAPTVTVVPGFDLNRRVVNLGEKVEVKMRMIAFFNDPGTLDSHTMALKWGDSDEVIIPAEAPFGPPGSALGADGRGGGDFTHIYTTPGSFDLKVCVTDDESAETCTLIVTLEVPNADLEIIKSVSPTTPVPVGENLTYTLAVTNNGPGAIEDVRVTDVLPPGTEFSAVHGDRGVIETKLIPGDLDLLPTEERDASFGQSLGVSGNFLVIGAPNFLDGLGAAHVFKATGADWKELQKLVPSDGTAGADRFLFGQDVAIDGDTLVVTAQSSGTTGAAYVFQYNGTAWLEIAKLLPDDGAAGDAFGASVAINGDTIVVGVPNRTAAYVFERNQGGPDQWGQLIKLESVLKPDFGADVSISGDTLVVTAPGSISTLPTRLGSATVFRRSGVWAEEATLTEADVAAVQEANTFAASVAIDADTLVIGTNEDSLSTAAGAAHVFQRSGTTWTEQAKLEASDSNLGDQFGQSVDIDADNILVGAPKADQGLLGDVGATYAFSRSGTLWQQNARLTPGNGEATDRFGSSVGVDGSTFVGGAPSVEFLYLSNSLLEVGAAFVFAYCPEGPPGTLICGLGTLPAGSSRVVQIVARIGCAFDSAPFIATSLTNTATVAGLGIDPNRLNNTDSVISMTAMPSVGVCGPDPTPPSVTPVVTGTLGNNSWYVSDVDVTWVVHDPDSIITSKTGCGVTLLNTDTASVTYTCEATSSGGTSSASVTIKRDATPPVMVPILGGTLGSAGWYTSNVAVTFNCSDMTAGVASCDGATILSDEGANSGVLGNAQDEAGNTSNVAVTGIMIDKTSPNISALRTPASNGNGWNKGAVTIDYTCLDNHSGVASCEPQRIINTEGASQSFMGDAGDIAGNQASVTEGGISIDTTLPTITADAVPPANVNGWRRSIVTVSFNCADTLSGVASCSENTHINTEGTGLAATGTVVDLAGNSATATTSNIDIDFTPPTITAATQPLPGPDGFTQPPVTISFTCNDDRSGIASCPPDIILNGIGLAQSAEGTATDRAGNTTSASVNDINIGRATLTLSGDQTAYEGELLNLMLAIVDPLAATSGTATVDWGDGLIVEPAMVTSSANRGEISGSHVYADDGSYQVAICVESLLGVQLCDTLQVIVSNRAPTVLTVVAPPDPVEFGTGARLLASFGDLGTNDTHTAGIDWGDGTPVETVQAIEGPFGPPGDTAGMIGEVVVDHVYATDGDFNNRVCIIDDDNGQDCKNFSLKVAAQGPPACAIQVGPVQCQGSTATIPLEVALQNSGGHPAAFFWSSDNIDGVFQDLNNNDFDDPTSTTPTLVTQAIMPFNVVAEAAFSEESGGGTVMCQVLVTVCGATAIVPQIPTVSEWAMGLLILLLAIGGILLLRRSRV